MKWRDGSIKQKIDIPCIARVFISFAFVLLLFYFFFYLRSCIHSKHNVHLYAMWHMYTYIHTYTHYDTYLPLTTIKIKYVHTSNPLYIFLPPSPHSPVPSQSNSECGHWLRNVSSQRLRHGHVVRVKYS